MSSPAYLFSLSKHPATINVKSLDVIYLKPKINFSEYDYFIITSKQAVEVLKQYETSEYISKKALAISKKSAEAYQAIGGSILETAEGYGSKISNNIKAYPKTTHWLYLRAETIASNFAQELNDEGYNIKEIITYKSECSKEIEKIEVESNATLIFTSPSSVECYLKSHIIDPKNKVIVIGLTTAKSLPEGIKYTLSQETTIESCVELYRSTC